MEQIEAVYDSKLGFTDKRPGRPLICESILETIGNTPLIRLSKFLPPPSPQVFVKLESFNPGGSAKDRAALAIVEGMERSGELRPRGRVVISTSGNMGIGLSVVCAYKGYRITCVIDAKCAPANEALLRLLGADLEKVEITGKGDDLHLLRIERAKALCAADPAAVYVDQYDNPHAIRAHYENTAQEIYDALEGDIDAVVVAAGTGGTIMGIARRLKELEPNVDIWAVDEHGSIALPSCSISHRRFLNGMGTAIRPSNYDYENFSTFIDKQVHVTAEEALSACIALARSEGILAGGSGGAAMHVTQRLIPLAYGETARVVVVVHDHASRYADTFFDSEWLQSRSFTSTCASLGSGAEARV